MYQWTHVELARHQSNGNGPKIDHDEKVQEYHDPAELNHNDEHETVMIASEERGESFATVKNKLLLCEVAPKISHSDPENATKLNGSDLKTESGEIQQNGSVEVAENGSNGINGHAQNDEHLKEDCDKKVEIPIVETSTFVEVSTQTDDIADAPVDLIEKKIEQIKACLPPPPPPPPPPPSPVPLICIVPPSDETDGKSENENSVVVTDATEQIPATPQQNSSQINISSTKLSSASSFCPPPPPPMNGVPGPPPLPLPTGNMWFKSDSKLSTFFWIIFIFLIEFSIT